MMENSTHAQDIYISDSRNYEIGKLYRSYHALQQETQRERYRKALLEEQGRCLATLKCKYLAQGGGKKDFITLLPFDESRWLHNKGQMVM